MSKMLVQCCVCHKVRNENNKWVVSIVPSDAVVSHTYCEECTDNALADIRRQKRMLEMEKIISSY